MNSLGSWQRAAMSPAPIRCSVRAETTAREVWGGTLLTMLDGLESTSAGRVCVMLTAMDVGNLPPALIRSGRVELWLETRLPDERAREAIMAKHLAQFPAPFGMVDVAQL